MAQELFKDLKKLKFDNGLTVILREDHNSHVCAIQIWVNTGSANETDREAGITHLIEHMIFKGTEKRGVGEIAQEIESCGGYINAYTSFDHTLYHAVVASRFFDLGLDVLQDAVQNAAFDPVELEREKEVVLEEIKRGEDIPAERLVKTLFSTAYQTHPYRRPIIGYYETVKSIDRETIFKYIGKWYRPQNMTVVVVGDFDSNQVISKIKSSFATFRVLEPSEFSLPKEAKQTELRTFTLKEDMRDAYLKMAYHIPDIHHEDVFALDCLSFILGQGESSRLSVYVKDKRRLVYSISSYAFTPKYPGLFIIAAALKGKDTREALKAILEEVERLRYEMVSEEELLKAKRNIEANFTYDMESVEGQARKFGEFETVWGDVFLEKNYLEKIKAVSYSDIQSVVKEYLNPQNLTVGISIPHQETTALTTDEIRQLVHEVKTDIQDIHRRKGSLEESVVRKYVLDNGLTLLIKENHAVPTVSLRVVFLGGLRFENEDNNGVNHFIAEMLTKGTEARSALDIAREVESIAGSIQGFSGHNTFGLSGYFLSHLFDKGMELIADIIMHPAFDEGELEKVRNIILAEIRMQDDNLVRFALRIFNQNLFQTHPYGMNILGTEDTVNRLARSDLIDFYRKFAIPQNMVLAIVGNVDTDRVVERVKELFEGLEGESFSPPEIETQAPPETVRATSVIKQREQVHVVLGFLGTTFSEEDRYPLEVLNAVLSGQGGRLFTNLRDVKSLAYGVTSFLRPGLDRGSFGVYIATSPEKLDEAVDGIKGELMSIAKDGVSEEELSRAKRYIIGTYEIGLQTNSDQAFDLAHNERYGLGYNFGRRYVEAIENVSVKDVLRVAQKYIQLDRYTLVTVGPRRYELIPVK